jgi:Sulfotransferase domain
MLRTQGRAALRQVSHGFGSVTSGLRMTPSVLIVGAQRCGTTSMFKALRQHPAVLAPALNKGIHYFDKRYGRGMGWYRRHFPLELTAGLVARRTGAQPVTLESSPYYMFHPLAGQRIAQDLPGVRLIVLVRDPVERAYSAHAHELARGYETEPFERAVDLEESRTAGEVERMLADPSYDSLPLQHNAYLARGRYIEQLQRLEKLVGRDRIHVVDSHDFFERPEPTFAQVVDFLGLPHSEAISFERHNARPRSPMADALRTRLEQHFEPYDELLAQWWGQTPGWRR